LASTSASDLAREVLDACLRERTWPSRALDDLIERALDQQDLFVARAATRALFGTVIEALGDLFAPDLCDVYARLFARVIARALPEYNAHDLLLRYNRIRQVRHFPGGEVLKVFVLSRVTLGADVAVTSVVLDAAKKRFPDAEICLVGAEKNAELFSGDTRITPVILSYGRSGLLSERLQAGAELLVAVDEPSSIVIDPDSRLTQLGLIPVGDDARYFFFESRAFGGDTTLSLPRLTAAWLKEVFDVEEARPYVAPPDREKMADITVSWGVGENQQKRVHGDFEYEVLSYLLGRDRKILLDRGAGGEEARRVDDLVRRLGSPARLHVHDGSYASFASHIVQSSLYVGYDSAGQHVAAAAGVPLVSVFSGFANERMLSRWSPDTPGSHIVALRDNDQSSVLDRTVAAISEGEAVVPMAASTD
jgi:hypothetical protein